MHIGVGGKYRLFKSGEIIPKLDGCVEEPKEIYKAPSLCPVCGQPLIREEDTADIRCINPSCPAQVSRTIAYFASRDAMNIMGLGDLLVDALVKEGYLSNYADIYDLYLHRGELVEKGIIGKEKNTDKLLREIENSKQNPPDRFLTGLAIRNVGRSTARTLMQSFDSIDALSRASEEELLAVPDIGATTARCILDFFHEENNRVILERFRKAGVNMAVRKEDGGSDVLEGKTFVVTGTLPTLGRNEITELIVKNGGKASGSVSRRTSYLIAGEAAGSKLAKAGELGVPVITEEDFLKMIHREG